MAGFGLAAVVFNFFLTLSINPDNSKAEIHEKHDNQDIKYFGPQIANNVPGSIRYLALFYACCTIPGALLLSKKDKTTEENSS